MKHYRHLLILLMLLVTTLMAYSKYRPYQINEDNSVTISVYAPNANVVKLTGTLLNNNESLIQMPSILSKEPTENMTDKGDGYWEYTSKPLRSDIYWYNFKIDGSIEIDKRNANVVRDINTLYNYFIIDGDNGNLYKDSRDLKGSLNYVWYPSSLNGMDRRRMAIYLPPGYDVEKSTRYAVLYLLHGSGGDETAWPECGRAVQILDNMISAGRCVPMIVVMPNGNVELAAAPGDDPNNPDVKPSATNITSMFGKFESSFMREIVQYVDNNFRTRLGKNNKAIAGLSLGGLHTLYISVNNPMEFSYVGLFSAQTTNALNNKAIEEMKLVGKEWGLLQGIIPSLAESKIGKYISGIAGPGEENLYIYEDFDKKLDNFYSCSPSLFYIAVGREDFTKKLNDDLRMKLYSRKHPFVYNESGGGHTWNNWRDYLIDFLPRLFRDDR